MIGAGGAVRGGALPGGASPGWPAGLEVGEVVERLPTALLLVALTGPAGAEPVVTGSNAAARRLLGRARLELHGVPLRSLLGRDTTAATLPGLGGLGWARGAGHRRASASRAVALAAPAARTATAARTAPAARSAQGPPATPARPAGRGPDSDPAANPVPVAAPEAGDDVADQVRAWRASAELLPGRLALALPDGTSAPLDGCALPVAPGRLPLLLLHLRAPGGSSRDRVRALERRVTDLAAQVDLRLATERRLREQLTDAGREAEEARASAEEARLSTEDFRLAFENAPVGTAVTDLDGRIHRANQALAGLLGRSVDDLSRLGLADLTHPDDVGSDADQLASLVAGRSTGYRVDKRYRRADGSEVRVAVTVSLAHGADGAPGHLVVQVEDVDDQRAAEAALERLALHDSLTGLPNRLLLRDRIRQALHRLGRASSGCGLLFLDLDKFKFVNDAYGHDVGDHLLHEIAQRISSGLRASDTASRIGGDEFVVLCEDVPDLASLVTVAERFERAVVRPLRMGDLTLSITASIGLTFTSDPAAEPDELLREADLAMYRAKEGGRARSEAFDAELAAEARARTDLERDLRHGIDHGDVVIHYQPIVDLRTRDLVRVEALVRWQHPSRGLLTPAAFIDLAEHTGLVVPLGEQVLRQACRTVADWNRRAGGGLGVSVNVSPRQLARDGFADLVAESLEDSELGPGLLQLEITESVLAQTSPTSANELAVVKRLGVGLGLDDFGTGFASLEYLKAFPVDVIKIDRGFVGAVGSSREDTAIVRSVIELARALDLDCVAEGIETQEQADALVALGSSHGQGYLFSRPVPFETIADGSWSAG